MYCGIIPTCLAWYCAHSPSSKYAELSHFTLLFCRGQQKTAIVLLISSFVLWRSCLVPLPSFKPTKGPGKRGHIVAHDVSWARKRAGHKMNAEFPSAAQARTHCCEHIVARDVSWATQTGPGNICCGHNMFKIRKIFCVRNKCCAHGQKGKHLCRQQRVGNNVSSFARALRPGSNSVLHTSRIEC